MKVKSEKKEKSQALGYILSLAAMAARLTERNTMCFTMVSRLM